ncbi:hypothetical protein MRB53_038023 [Persea americana]|nr:hypothetical protein MRB53_038023 [Persea americana]
MTTVLVKVMEDRRFVEMQDMDLEREVPFIAEIDEMKWRSSGSGLEAVYTNRELDSEAGSIKEYSIVEGKEQHVLTWKARLER